MTIKPMKASDAVLGKIVYPVFVQPKIDGVRALNVDSVFVGRSLKPHRNEHLSDLFCHNELHGFDGEVACGVVTGSSLCRDTSSALSRRDGTPEVIWWIFDYVTAATVDLPYHQRMQLASERLEYLQANPLTAHFGHRMRLMPTRIAHNVLELDAADSEFVEAGYEGTIVRGINCLHKEGYSTVREGGLLRIKRFVDAEVKVTELVEAQLNENEAQINELGLQFRTSHQAGKTGKGMVGSLLGTLLTDVKDAQGSVVLRAGDTVTIGPGAMTHQERTYYFNNPDAIVGQFAKFKFFPHGVKDAVRFPTFLSLRNEVDL